MARRGEPLSFLFASLGDDTDECIDWPYAKARGYGRVLYEGFVWPAHRLVCHIAHGACPPDKDEAAHRCGNPSCVNKKHVRWATRSENAQDKKTHGTHDLCGRKPLLTSDQVKWARSMRGSMTVQSIADELGVFNGTIRSLFLGKTYKKVA